MYIPMSVTFHDVNVRGDARTPPEVEWITIHGQEVLDQPYFRVRIQNSAVTLFYSPEGLVELAHAIADALDNAPRGLDQNQLHGAATGQHDQKTQQARLRLEGESLVVAHDLEPYECAWSMCKLLPQGTHTAYCRSIREFEDGQIAPAEVDNAKD